MKICLTFDVERDFNYTSLTRATFVTEPKFTMIERSIPRIGKILRKYDVKATFFLTGEVARNVPELFRTLLDERHEIGVHTHPYSHPSISKGSSNLPHSGVIATVLQSEYTRIERKEMIREDIEIIKESLRIQPQSFRGGHLSMSASTLEILRELEIRYDSSLFMPSYHDSYMHMSLAPLLLKAKLEKIVEVPVFPDIDILSLPSIRSLHLKSWRRRFPLLYERTALLSHPMVLGAQNMDIEKLYNNLVKIIQHCLKNKIELCKLKKDEEWGEAIT